MSVRALRRRPDNIIDRWDDPSYQSVMVYDGKPVEVEVTQEGASGKPVLHVIATSERIVPGLKSALTHALERMLGLRIDLSKFYDFVKEEKKLYELSRRFLGLKPPRFFNRYEALANSFACQQLSLIVGIVLLNRLAMRCGLPFEKGGATVYTFPQPERVARLHPGTFRKMGFSRRKGRALAELSQGGLSGNWSISKGLKLSTTKRR
jgi:DNA-3-methyladenine glycosylase II